MNSENTNIGSLGDLIMSMASAISNDEGCSCGDECTCQDRICFPGVTRVVLNMKDTESRAKRDEAGNLVIDEATKKPVRESVKLEKPVYTTTVFFDDGSKATVKEYGEKAANKELGIVYAIIKRLYGRVGEDGNVIADGLSGFLSKLVKNAWDQPTETLKNKQLKEEIREKNIKRQKDEQKAAHERLIKRLAKELKHWNEAADFLKKSEGIEVPQTLINEVATGMNDHETPAVRKIEVQ